MNESKKAFPSPIVAAWVLSLSSVCLLLVDGCRATLPPMPQPYVINRFTRKRTGTTGELIVRKVTHPVSTTVAAATPARQVAGDEPGKRVPTLHPATKPVAQGTWPKNRRRLANSLKKVRASIHILTAFNRRRGDHYARQVNTYVGLLNRRPLNFGDDDKINAICTRLLSVTRSIDSERTQRFSRR